MEKTLILLKPDTLMRGLTGTLLSRFESKGLKIVGIKMMRLGENLLREHYSHLVDKSFFSEIVEFMTRTPVIVLCLEGLEAVTVCRRICGVTNSREASTGSIRGDFGMSMQANLVHASDSTQSAKIEIARFFNKDDLFSYDSALLAFLYAFDER